MKRAGPVLLLLWLLGLPAGPARAFVRSHVDGDPTNYLHWESRTIPVFLNRNGSEDVDPGAMRAAVIRATTAWSANPCTDLFLYWGGTTSNTQTNLTSSVPDNVNTLVWREAGEWPADVSSGTLALTTLVYDRVSGELVDGDIDFNGEAFYWTATDDRTTAETDVQNTVTHELGHLIGLDHTDDPEATMFGASESGDFGKRDLGEDDLAGLCYIYPADADTPSETIVSEPAPLELKGSACAVTPGRAPVSLAGLLPLLALVPIGLLRRRTS